MVEKPGQGPASVRNVAQSSPRKSSRRGISEMKTLRGTILNTGPRGNKRKKPCKKKKSLVTEVKESAGKRGLRA